MKDVNELKNMGELISCIESAWGDSGDTAYALLNFLGNDFDYLKEVVISDKTYNRYECTNSIQELACEIINDDCLWEDGYSELYHSLDDNYDDEVELERILLNEGWCIDLKNGVSILFEDSVNVINRKIDREIQNKCIY